MNTCVKPEVCRRKPGDEPDLRRSGVRFSKLPRTFRARKHFGALFGCFSRVPKSVSQNTRKCPELSPDIFRESFRVTGYDNATRAGGKIILEHGFIITTFNFSS